MNDQRKDELYFYDENHRFLDYQHSVPDSDIKDQQNLLVQQQKMAQELLSTVGEWLNHADNALDSLTGQEEMVGNAILRKCQELADVVGDVANQLEQHTEEERQRLAQACIQDVVLRHSSSDNNLLQRRKMQIMQQESAIMEEAMTPPTVDEMVAALDVASSLLSEA